MKNKNIIFAYFHTSARACLREATCEWGPGGRDELRSCSMAYFNRSRSVLMVRDKDRNVSCTERKQGIRRGSFLLQEENDFSISYE